MTGRQTHKLPGAQLLPRGAVAAVPCKHASPFFLLLHNVPDWTNPVWSIAAIPSTWCLLCSAVADFVRSFGGDPITQAAWQLTGLPPLPRDAALTGTDYDGDLEDLGFDSPPLSPSPPTQATAASNWQSPPPSRYEGPNCTVLVQEFGLGPLLGPESEALLEPQLVCVVQGVRLLVTLLRERQTWEPVSDRQPYPPWVVARLLTTCNPCRWLKLSASTLGRTQATLLQDVFML